MVSVLKMSILEQGNRKQVVVLPTTAICHSLTKLRKTLKYFSYLPSSFLWNRKKWNFRHLRRDDGWSKWIQFTFLLHWILYSERLERESFFGDYLNKTTMCLVYVPPDGTSLEIFLQNIPFTFTHRITYTYVHVSFMPCVIIPKKCPQRVALKLGR